MMDKPIFVDYETKICSAYLNAVAATVWDALGQATNPQEARQFIGAVEEAPTDGSSYARQNAQWVEIQVGNLHNDLIGRSDADAHPIAAITGLQASLDQINIDISGKAPASAGTAAGTSFSPSGTVAATNVQAAIAEVSGDVTALQATVSGLGTPAASAVTFSPTGTVAATNVQAAIAEVASEKVAKSGDTMTGNLTAPAVLVSAAQNTSANALTRKDYVDAPKSGQVIQTIFAKDAGSIAIGASGSLANTTLAAKTITPKSTNSTIKVSVSTYLYGTSSQSAGGNFVNAQIYCSSGGAPQGDVISVGNTNGNISQQIATNTIIEHVFDNTNLTPKSFELFACNSLSGTSSDGAAALQVWTLTEVQN